jgi:transglutaminase-like putative cysteine protease
MYDDRPSPLAQALVLCSACVATFLLGPALASFWHMDTHATAALWLLALGGVALARWPLAYLALPPLTGAVLYWLPSLRQGLALELSVWYTDLRLGFWPAPTGMLAWAFLACALLALAFLFVREPLRRGTGFWSIAAGTVLLGHMWLWGDDLSLRQFQLFLPVALLLWVAGGAAAREQRWWKAGRRVVQGVFYLDAVMVAVVLASLAAWVMPAPSRGLTLGPVTAWLKTTFPALEEIRGAGEDGREPTGFTLATAGLARRLSELGGPVKLDQAVALRIRFTGAPPADTLYLRGTAMTHYNGRGWVAETLPGDTGPDSPPHSREINMEITPLAFGGATLFYPRELSAIHGAAYTFGQEGSVLVKGPLPEQYRITALLPVGRPSGFGAPQYDPGRYVALPKSLPKRVRDLAHTVAAGQSSPYDQALAVEEYLRTETTYALDVPATPPGRDFVDYYLFDLKRGYCSYSATAMVVMLRTLGISARWVQGFAVAPGQAVVDLPWANAHAWVEAYFPGYGWATFDPTPRFALPGRAGSEQAVPAAPDEGPALAGPEGPGDEAQPVSVPAGPQRGFPWAPSLAGLVLLTWLTTNIRRFYRERIDWADERQGLVRAFAVLSGILRRMGLGRRPHQTPAEYARSVAAAWPEVGTPMAQAAADVTAAQFAPTGAPAPGGARRRMGGLLAAVWFRSQQRLGLLRTAWVRFRHTWGKD